MRVLLAIMSTTAILTPLVVDAQQPAPSTTLTICGMQVQARIVPPAPNIPQNVVGFLGFWGDTPWIRAFRPRTPRNCVGFGVEEIVLQANTGRLIAKVVYVRGTVYDQRSGRVVTPGEWWRQSTPIPINLSDTNPRIMWDTREIVTGGKLSISMELFKDEQIVRGHWELPTRSTPQVYVAEMPRLL
jgi:hypothetical protein